MDHEHDPRVCHDYMYFWWGFKIKMKQKMANQDSIHYLVFMFYIIWLNKIIIHRYSII